MDRMEEEFSGDDGGRHSVYQHQNRCIKPVVNKVWLEESDAVRLVMSAAARLSVESVPIARCQMPKR